MRPIPRRREDILVSLCFAGLDDQSKAVASVQSAAQKLGQNYRFWEIVFVTDADVATEEFVGAVIAAAPNIRVIKVASGTSFYRQRVIAASESIGDVAVLSAPDELEAVNIPQLVELAQETGAAVSCSTGKGTSGGWVYKTLGAMSGFSVSPRYTLTVSYPRAWINRVQNHPERDLAMRFPPRNASFPYRQIPIANAQQRDVRQMGRRAGLIYRLLVNIAPKLLPVIAAISLIVALFGLTYLIYAVFILLTLENIAAGWFSTAVAQSIIAFFLGVVLLGIVMALQKLLDLLEPDIDTTVVEEINNVDLFDQVLHDLNVEIEHDAATPIDAPLAEDADDYDSLPEQPELETHRKAKGAARW
ncbi:hypothetical protein M3P21_17235 [Ruegeria sp. 2012CJ41-6]|uniref:Glycosyltransferase n=1 Tax=Ruegeria spongiae TaxID=2942209 RepID=A0ABT0Q623_9RHOB|nr:hypothetical protein [Ruegeria spongiae]MCL6285275.1 hypothetical protein [Ruegeria spongiae]